MLIHAGPESSLPNSVLLHLFCSGLDIDAALYLYIPAEGSFTHKTTTKQKKILSHILEKHASSIVEPKPLQKKGMSSFEEPSSAESKPVLSLDSTHEPTYPKPGTPKERVIHPSEFPVNFKDYGNTSNHSWHKKTTLLSKEVSPRAEPSKEWLLKVKRSSEAIRILSPSMMLSCLFRGTSIKALCNPTVGTNIMSQFLAETLLGKMPLVSTKKLFKSPSGLECCGIVRACHLNLTKPRFAWWVLLQAE